MRLTSLHSVATVVALHITLSSSGAAQTNPAFVGEKTLRDACAYARKTFPSAPRGTNEGDLVAYCDLPSPLANPAAWDSITVPKPDFVIAASQGRHLTGAGALPAAGLIANAVLPSEGVILLGFTEFVVNRAKSEATTYIVNRFAADLCTHPITVDVRPEAKSRAPEEAKRARDTTRVAEFLPSTCELLSTGTAQSLLGNGMALPSFAVVQSSLRRDVDTLPDLLIGRFTKFAQQNYSGIAITPAVRPAAQRVTALIGASRIAASYLRRVDVPTAFRLAAEDMSAAAVRMCLPGDRTDPCRLPMDALPVLRALLVGSAFIGAVDPAHFPGLMKPGAARDSTLLLTGKALLVNAAPPMKEPITAAQSAFASFVLNVFKLDVSKPLGATGGGAVSDFLAANGQVVDSSVAVATRVADQLKEAKGDRTKIVSALVSALPDLEALVFMALEIDDAATAPQVRVLAAQVDALVRRVAQFKDMQLRARYGEIIADAMTLARSVAGDQLPKLLEEYSLPPAAGRAIQFAVDASQTQDADAFAATLEHYAAPADAFMRKRVRALDRSGLYWTLNAYVGGRYGRETAYGDNIPTGKGGKARYSGLTIPAGVEFGMARNCCGSLGLFVQLIDVGQVASWRSDQPDTAVVKTTPPTLTLGSVYSPGLNLVWNVPKIPLTIGAGISNAPQFRDLTATTDNTRPKASVKRSTVFAAIDVPILP